MEGFRILARGKNSDKINAVIYLLFAERDCYVVMSLINSDSSQSNELSNEYLSRIQFTYSVKPGLVFVNEAYKEGFRVGRFMSSIAIGLALVIAILYFIRCAKS